MQLYIVMFMQNHLLFLWKCRKIWNQKICEYLYSKREKIGDEIYKIHLEINNKSQLRYGLDKIIEIKHHILELIRMKK